MSQNNESPSTSMPKAPEWGEVKLERLGSEYGGWIIPQNFITKDSICYCAGVGEDISFDLTLINKYGCRVWAFDPTPRAATYAKENTPSGFPYNFLDWGLWDQDTELQFFPPSDPTHVSHSIQNLQGTSGGFTAKVRRLKSIMQELGHSRLDLLKIDIEGAEYRVLDSIIQDSLDVGVLCIEFHDMPDQSGTPESSTRSLEVYGYTLVYIEDKNYTYLRTNGEQLKLVDA